MAIATSENVPDSAPSRFSRQPFWLRTILGVVLIVAGIFVLGDMALATVVGTIALGLAAVVGGGVEIAHAFSTKGWGAFAWKVLLGILYLVLGVVLIGKPALSAVILTWVLGLVLLAAGVVRVVLGFRFGWSSGGLLLLSGIVGILAGLVVLIGWPITGSWAIGLLLAIDFIGHGVAWLVVAWRARDIGPTSNAGHPNTSARMTT